MSFSLENVRKASYKEVGFVMDLSAVSGGRKDVVHEFVNSDKQVVEDLGLKRKTYAITAVIHGENYERDKNSLLSVLEDGKKGRLVHPFDGNLENMVVRTFSLSENFTSFGVATFQIEFSPSDDLASPTRSFSSVSEVEAQVEITENVIQDALAEGYSTDPSLLGSIENSISKAEGFISDFSNVTQGFQGAINTVNQLNGLIIGFNDEIASLVQDPLSFADSIRTLFDTANNAFPNALQTLEMMEKLFDFGSTDIPQLDILTAGIIEINKNNDLLNYVIKSFSLTNAYLQLSKGEFDTVSEIERQEAIIEEQYDLVTNIESLSDDVRKEITNLRVIASEVISELKTTTPDLIEIELTNKIALRKNEYLRYGENTRTDSLISINNLQDIGFVNGTLEFLNDSV